MISIVVPAFNAEKTLGKCIESILAQTLQDLQIIIINDGSVDSTSSICEQLMLKDNRIEAYQIEHKGAVAARKIGLKKAKGEYIGFVDADDYIDADMFCQLQKMLIKSDADFVHSGYIEENQGQKNIVCNFEEKVVEFENFRCRLDFLKKYVLEGDKENVSQSIWSKLFKADFIKKCFEQLSDEQQYGEDLLCLSRCIFESKRIMLYKNAMYHYVVNEHSLSHGNYDDYLINMINMCHYFINVLEEYCCLETLKESTYHFLKKQMLYVILKTGCRRCKLPQYYIKDIDYLAEKQVVIFGAGSVGQDYYVQVKNYAGCHIVAWIDSKWDNYHFEYGEVISVKEINKIMFDLVVIAVNDEKLGVEMKDNLIELGVEKTKIFWQKPGRYFW